MVMFDGSVDACTADAAEARAQVACGFRAIGRRRAVTARVVDFRGHFTNATIINWNRENGDLADVAAESGHFLCAHAADARGTPHRQYPSVIAVDRSAA
ncbi:hypothetical protein EVAR_29805_1 [Eumeta japonica]|uniref:Uncharacterized protein n=1 Tax=Eumeta variegata TaxID=151549 RepID=A0A4C1XMV5_EUMVA|nr:hypothetical protein EVAR_29805_1 [Eumeta japonica]